MGTPGPSFHREGPGRETRPGHSDPVPFVNLPPAAVAELGHDEVLKLTQCALLQPLVALVKQSLTSECELCHRNGLSVQAAAVSEDVPVLHNRHAP